MHPLKYFCLVLFISALFSCGNGRKEIIENRIRQINGIIGLFQAHVDERGAAISNISTLSQAKKDEYHYDSLVHVQEVQIHAIKVFQAQVDSLKGVLNSFK
jgi:hypothetical protein